MRLLVALGSTNPASAEANELSITRATYVTAICLELAPVAALQWFRCPCRCVFECGGIEICMV